MPADVHNLTSRKKIGKAKDLLHSLVPRAQSFCFYDTERKCIWSSDGAEDYEIDEFVEVMPADVFEADDESTNFIRRTLKSGRTLLLMPVGAEEQPNVGTLVCVFSRNAGKSSWFNPRVLYGVIAPALAVLAESVTLNDAVGKLNDKMESVEKELTLLYEVDEKIHSLSRSHSGLAHLIGQSGRFLNIAYSVLLIPSKRIRVSATHASWKNVQRKVIDRYLLDQVLPMVEGTRVPLVFEMPEQEGLTEEGYQALVCPISDKAGNVHGFLAQLGRVNNRPFTKHHRRLMAHIARKAEYVIEQSFDTMTGLMNRAGFEAQLNESFKALRTSGDSHQLIYMDLDNLQLINDTFGRKAGDEVITRFASMIEHDLPRSAVASRLTGDDFCILLTHADDEAALDLAETLRKRSQALRYLEGDKSLQVTISIGIATFSRSEGDGGKALTSARLACDSAKDHGRDRIEVFNINNQSIIQRHDDMELVADIQHAIDSDGFVLLAQEIVALDAKDSSPCYEILLRMKDREDNEISTKDFFSAAERYQIMPQIDRWVTSATLKQLSGCAELVKERGARFSINLSGQSLGDDDILEFVKEEIEASGVPMQSIGFEVTESAAVSNFAKAQHFISQLHSQGCSFSLDDFGAGLSSFAYLKNFTVDTLKIDGSFIRDITENQISESMVVAITQVARVMGLETVAEYVENEESKKRLEKLGVNYAQGYLFGQPRLLSEVLEDFEPAAESTG
ncbi:MAG: EAL domain-containing protein [Pseudomonadota bacterium]